MMWELPNEENLAKHTSGQMRVSSWNIDQMSGDMSVKIANEVSHEMPYELFLSNE